MTNASPLLRVCARLLRTLGKETASPKVGRAENDTRGGYAALDAPATTVDPCEQVSPQTGNTFGAGQWAVKPDHKSHHRSASAHPGVRVRASVRVRACPHVSAHVRACPGASARPRARAPARPRVSTPPRVHASRRPRVRAARVRNSAQKLSSTCSIRCAPVDWSSLGRLLLEPCGFRCKT